MEYSEEILVQYSLEELREFFQVLPAGFQHYYAFREVYNLYCYQLNQFSEPVKVTLRELRDFLKGEFVSIHAQACQRVNLRKQCQRYLALRKMSLNVGLKGKDHL